MGKGWRTALQPDAEGEDSRMARAVQGTYSTFPVTSDVLASDPVAEREVDRQVQAFAKP